MKFSVGNLLLAVYNIISIIFKLGYTAQTCYHMKFSVANLLLTVYNIISIIFRLG